MTTRSILRAVLGAALPVLVAPALHAQVNIDLVGQLSYHELHNGSDLANLWGYTDELGNEYALVGVNGTEGETGGISVVDLSDPAHPQEIFFHPGPTSIWREIKVWEDHAYMTTEAHGGGVVIVDLSPLPQSHELPVTQFLDPAWDTSHSLFIDEHGRLYIHGANQGNGGVIMYDLVPDPEAPVRVGQFDTWYAHDSFARGDTLYAAHITSGFFSIVDVSDPANPVLLGQHATPNQFTHNTWLDANGHHLYTTDERASGYVATYDVSDPTDIRFLDKLQSDPGSYTIPHNTYWLPGDYLVQSYYTYGVSIYDVSDPENMVEVGSFDTSPLSGAGFFGAWGVYPFFPSGRLIVSDIEEGLFVLAPTYARAGYIEGTISSAASGLPVPQALVTLTGTPALDLTGIDGRYSTGVLHPGTYTLSVSAPGYFPTTVEVVIATGTTTTQNIQLTPLPTYSVSGAVRTQGSGEPVPGAQVRLVNSTYTFSTTTATDGTFAFPAVYDGSYTLDIGAWGWHGACPPDLVVAGADRSGLEFDLMKGFADDFALNLGWVMQHTASRGNWEIGDPAGTTYQGAPSNPDVDVPGDCRDNAYVTGNSGGSPGSDDVDEGWTRLVSPEFDATGMPDPHVRYFWWFVNKGTGTPPNDSLIFSLSNGMETTAVQIITNVNTVDWRPSNIRIADHITPTSTMRFIAYASDLLPTDHLVEAGLDDFEVVPEANTGIADPDEQAGIAVWPNPSTSTFIVRQPEQDGELWLQLYDPLGRSVPLLQRARRGYVEVDAGALPVGTYVLHVTDGKGIRRIARVVIAR
jgi:choice-of-anchor B domain-containing protein